MQKKMSTTYNIGDDITVSGKIIFVKDNYIEIETPSHDEIWVKIVDIKTHRPNMKESKQMVRRCMSCDICGQDYEENWIYKALLEPFNLSLHMFGRKLDLCPDCRQELNSLFDRGRYGTNNSGEDTTAQASDISTFLYIL